MRFSTLSTGLLGNESHISKDFGVFMPPTRSRVMLRMAPAVERFGQRWLGRFAGVTVIEAGKQLYAGIAERSATPGLVAVRPKLRVASSRDTQAARNAGDGEAPAS